MKMTNRAFRQWVQFMPVLLVLAAFANCGSAGSGVISDPSTIAVDSTNDRVFVSQARGELLALKASNLHHLLDDQPVIDSDTNEDLNDALPEVLQHMAVYSDGTTSRLFMMGRTINESDNAVLNRILVLDFDGSSFAFSTISPIELSDGDDATDNEIDNSFADLLVDQSKGQFYVTDATAGLLYVYSATTGIVAHDPVNIGGTPRGMWLDGDQLYVCNSSDDAAEQVVSVFDTDDFSEHEIDLDVPCDEIAVAHNTSGTVLAARRVDQNQVLVKILDTDAFTVTDLPSSDSSITSGQLNPGTGITSNVNDIVVAADSSGVISVYLSEIDGNIEYLSISADLAAFTLTTSSTLALDIDDGALYLDGSGLGISVYFISGSGSLLQIDVGDSDVNAHS